MSVDIDTLAIMSADKNNVKTTTDIVTALSLACDDAKAHIDILR